MLTIINDPEVITFSSVSSDKAKLFAINFAANSILDNQGHLLLDFPTLMELMGSFQASQEA